MDVCGNFHKGYFIGVGFAPLCYLFGNGFFSIVVIYVSKGENQENI